MAEMMEALQHRLEYAFLSQRFFIFGQIGAAIVLLTSLEPFFAAYNIPAIIVLAITITWDLWRGAGKTVRTVLAAIVLLIGLWILINTIGQFVMPISEEEILALFAAGDMGGAIEHMVIGVIQVIGGAVGQLPMLIAGLFGIMAARKMPAA